MNELIKLVTEKIPEATFDLISRILPGGIVVAAVLSSQKFSALLSALGIITAKPTNSFEIVVFLIFAYAFGLAISALARLCIAVAWLVVYPILLAGGVHTSINKTLRCLRIEYDNLDWNPAKAMRIIDFTQEYIKSNCTQEGALVIKLLAEVGLLYNLALSICLVALLCNIFSQQILIALILPLFLAAVIRSIRTWYKLASILDVLCQS